MTDKVFLAHLNHVAAAAQALVQKEEKGGCWPGERTKALDAIQNALDEAKRSNKDSHL